MTEPTVGAWVWASGSQVWNGKIGTLMPKPMNMPPKIRTAAPDEMPRAARGNRVMSKVCTAAWPLTLIGLDRKYRARKLTIIRAEPNSVNRKNLIEAYWRCSPPHTPIMKYMGRSTTSKNTKNKMRSCARKVPTIPVSSTRMRIRKALGLCGSGKWFHE